MSKNTVAFQKLLTLAEPKNLSAKFELANQGSTSKASITSCSATADIVIRTLTNQAIGIPLVGLKNLVNGGMQGVLTETVKKTLKKTVIMYFMLKFTGKDSVGGGDHHFCAFPLDSDTVVVAMGWQNIYDLSDWISDNERGLYKTSNFLSYMKKIEDGSSLGVIDLCAFLGVSKKGAGVVSEITREVQGFRPRFISAFYLELPNS